MSALDFGQIFEDGLNAKNAASSEWHREPSYNEYRGEYVYHWHASELAGCPRRAILKRAGVSLDATPVDSLIAFEFGHTLHKALEDIFGTIETDPLLLSEGDWGIISVEKGGPHPDLNLKARPDAILRNEGMPVLFDLKTEGDFARKMRLQYQKDTGAADAASFSHKLQITAGAIVAEGRGMVDQQVTRGMVAYVSRGSFGNSWTFDTQEFVIDEALRERVLDTVAYLDAAWDAYEVAQELALPPRLPEELKNGKYVLPWQCRPRSKDDPRGKYCETRSACFDLPPAPIED
jgi:hypothetical protein